MFRNIWRETKLQQSSMMGIIIWNIIQEEGRKSLFSYGGLLENVLENIIFGQVALYVGERYRKPLEGLPPLKRGAGSFTKHSHFSLEIKKKYNGWSFIKMDHTAVYHNFHIFHLNVCTSSFNFCDLKKMQTFTFKRNIPIWFMFSYYSLSLWHWGGSSATLWTFIFYPKKAQLGNHTLPCTLCNSFPGALVLFVLFLCNSEL